MESPTPSIARDPDNAEFDLRLVFSRFLRDLPLTFGLALLFAVIALTVTWLTAPTFQMETRMRVAFSFPGSERGEYPDGSKFLPDDLKAPDSMDEAMKSSNLPDDSKLQSLLRGSISTEGLIPQNITKERERLRSLGQVVPPYIPDEYEISLMLPRSAPISSRQREIFLINLSNAFRNRFRRLYSETPIQFGAVFTTLRDIDYYEYEIALNQEVQNLTAFIAGVQEKAKGFRSPSTDLTFSDLSSDIQLFSQVTLTDTLASINSMALTTNRTDALRKIHYYIARLDDDERRLTNEEKVVNDLLERAQNRGQSYVLSAKAQTESNSPIISQNILDTLVASDAYNFLIRKSLDAGIRVQDVHARKEKALNMEKELQDFSEKTQAERAALTGNVNTGLSGLEVKYTHLVNNIKLTYQDYTHQQFADAVRVTMQPESNSIVHALVLPTVIAFFVGLFSGISFSLLSVQVSRARLRD
jgi:hypothetical protein